MARSARYRACHPLHMVNSLSSRYEIMAEPNNCFISMNVKSTSRLLHHGLTKRIRRVSQWGSTPSGNFYSYRANRIFFSLRHTRTQRDISCHLTASQLSRPSSVRQPECVSETERHQQTSSEWLSTARQINPMVDVLLYYQLLRHSTGMREMAAAEKDIDILRGSPPAPKMIKR